VKPIPVVDLQRQPAALHDAVAAALARVTASGRYILGDEVEAFEHDFARYLSVAAVIGVSSGTAALELALRACEIGPGDEVITVPMTFVATVAAILYAGATPRFVDIDPATWTMDPAAMEAAITPRTRAIMPVHLHGRVADMAPIAEIAQALGLVIIEDAAQAHGAHYRGRRAGAIGDLGCFSFYPGKNLGACGEGGAVVTDRDDLAERIRMLRDWGQAERYRHVLPGYNYRMDAIQGAVLAVKLRYLERWTEARRDAAATYQALLADLPVGRPAACDRNSHVWHVYAVRVRERDRLRAQLAEAGISTGIHYPSPVHLQPAYAGLGYRRGDFPLAEQLAEQTLSLPMFPELTRAQIERVSAALSTLLPNNSARVVAA